MKEINKQIEAIKVALQLLKSMGEISQTGVDSILLGLEGMEELIKNLIIPNYDVYYNALNTCPVCCGRGLVPVDFYLSQTNEFRSITGDEQCRSCNGTGIIWHEDNQNIAGYDKFKLEQKDKP